MGAATGAGRAAAGPTPGDGRGQADRVARDRLVAEDAARNAHRLGIRVIVIDGTLDAAAVAAESAEQFAPCPDVAAA